jgi:gamma-glutamyltranspeptidase / glutathione hydrolase
MAEALKLSFADRLEYAGDHDFVDVPLDRLLSKEWAAERRRLIDPGRAMEEAGSVRLTPADTTYLCAADGTGLMISLIISISQLFGSAVVAGDTGVLLNNRAGHCFSLEAGHPNIYAPGKKTMHTLNCYAIADDGGNHILVGGTPGADGQPQWNLQMVSALIDSGEDVQAAVEAPRWSVFPGTYPAHMGNPYELRIEDQIGEETLGGLRERGHRVVPTGPWGQGGAAQLITRNPETGVLVGGSDPRSEGMAAGF